MPRQQIAEECGETVDKVQRAPVSPRGVFSQSPRAAEGKLYG